MVVVRFLFGFCAGISGRGFSRKTGVLRITGVGLLSYGLWGGIYGRGLGNYGRRLQIYGRGGRELRASLKLGPSNPKKPAKKAKKTLAKPPKTTKKQ